MSDGIVHLPKYSFQDKSVSCKKESEKIVKRDSWAPDFRNVTCLNCLGAHWMDLLEITREVAERIKVVRGDE